MPAVTFPTSVPRLAWPAIVSQGIDYSSIAIFFAIVAGTGQQALAGGRVAFQLTVLSYGILGAFGAAGRILIGRSAGADDLGEAHSLWRVNQGLLACLAVPAGAFLAIWPRPVAELFTSFPQIISAAEQAFRLVGPSLVVQAWTLGGVSVLRALGRTKWDMWGNLIAAVAVQLPISWLFADELGLGISGAFCGVLAYWLSRGAAAEVLARIALARALRAAARPAEHMEPTGTAGRG